MGLTMSHSTWDAKIATENDVALVDICHEERMSSGRLASAGEPAKIVESKLLAMVLSIAKLGNDITASDVKLMRSAKNPQDAICNVKGSVDREIIVCSKVITQIDKINFHKT